MIRRLMTASILIGLGMFIAGCGNSGAVPVSGKVTYNGQPVANANVIFTPKNGRPAVGKTDAEGKYTLSNVGKDDGAVEGVQTVTITPNYDQPPPMIGTPEAKKWKPPKAPFPARYGDPKTSNLTATVTRGDKEPINFELKD